MIDVADFLNETREILAPPVDSKVQPGVPENLRPSYGMVVAIVLGFGFWIALGISAWQFWN